MSFKDFSRLNEFIATTADVTDKLNSIVSACQQGLSQLSAIKQISDAYARQYSLVQQIQYDADGNIQDVTSSERLSVPNTVLDNAKDVINKCSLAIEHIKPLDLGSLTVDLNIKPVAKLYGYDGINTNEPIVPQHVTTVNDYYYTSGQSLFLSSEFIDALLRVKATAGFMHNSGGTIDNRHPTIVKLPYIMQGNAGNHQLAIIGAPMEGNYYIRHTGEFVKYSKLSDIASKDLFAEGSYNIDYRTIGGKIEWASWTNSSGKFTMVNGTYGMPGDILNFYYAAANQAYTAISIDCYHEVTTGATDNIWAVLTGLADNGAKILNILNNI